MSVTTALAAPESEHRVYDSFGGDVGLTRPVFERLPELLACCAP